MNKAITRSSVNLLPVSDPMITTYTQHAHLLSILSNYEYTYPWIFTNYIQLYINKDYKHNWGDFYFPSPYEVRPSDTCQWIISQKINRKSIARQWNSAVDFVVDSIHSNHYVHAMVNLFYVPVSDCYHEVHLNHDLLVYGYDLDQELFYVSDFFKGGIYSREVISFKDFNLAFLHYDTVPHHKELDYLNGLIYLYQFDQECKYRRDLDIQAVMNSIRHYLNNTVPEYWHHYNFGADKEKLDFGRQIYATLKNYAKTTSELASALDIRPFYLLYDHKKIMMLRLQYLYNNGYIGEDAVEAIRHFSVIQENARIAVNIVLKYNASLNKRLIDRLLQTLTDIDDAEFENLKLLSEIAQA